MSDNFSHYICVYPIDHNIMTNHKVGRLNSDKYAKLHGAVTVENILNTLRMGLLNCLNVRSRGLNNVIQLLYCVSLKIYNKFANYFCELKFSGNTHQRP